MRNEEWKNTGDCSKCRRRDYCKKECSASKKNTQRVLKNAMFKVLTERLGKKNGA